MQYGENQDSENNKFSKINSAGLINLRLHRLWEDCNRHSRQGKFLAWNADLDTIWRELSGDVNLKPRTKNNPKDKDVFHETFEEWKKIREELKELAPIKNWKTIDGFQTLDNDDSKKKSDQYEKLMDKEVFLRTLMNKQGKGSAYEDSIDDYMDE